MSFGWSAGDIVLAIRLLVKIGSALREADGAKAEFQDAAGSLAGLEMTLQYLEQQQQAADKQGRATPQGTCTSVTQHPARNDMLLGSIDLIKGPVSSFLDDIEKYDKSLGTRSKAHFTSGARRKIQWAFFVSDKVKELQNRIAIPMHNLNILQHQTTLESISDLRQTLPSDIGHPPSTKIASTTGAAASLVNVPYFLVPYTPNPDFVGRSAILDRLKTALAIDVVNQRSQPQARAALWGLGGAGKSQIAIKYAYWLRESDPDISIFWIYGGATDRFRQAYEDIAQCCSVAINGGPNGDLLNSVAGWLAANKNRRWLMIIDNADDSEVFFDSPGSRSTLSKYIPDCSHGALLVTTRNKEVGVKLTKGRGLIEIPEMDKDESKELISKGMEGNIDDDAAVERLTGLLEYLPLALAQAAAFMQQNTLTISEYLEMYEEGPEAFIDLLSVPFEGQGRDNEVPNPVAATWMISFNQIRRTNTRAADMMCLMACLDRQAIPQELIRNHDESLLEFKRARGLLIAFSLVHVDFNVDNCSMHRLVHLVVRKWLETRGELAKWISTALELIWRRIPKDVDTRWEVFTAYQPHLHAAIQLPSQRERDRLSKSDLLYMAYKYHDARQDFEMSKLMLLQSIAIEESILGKEHRRLLFRMKQLARVYLEEGEISEAERICSETIGTARITLGGDHELTLKIRSQLAAIYSAQGKVDESVSLLLQTIETAEQRWGEDYENQTLVGLKDTLLGLYQRHGRLEDAEKLCLEMMHRCERMLREDHPSTLLFTASLVWMYMSSERWSDAEGPTQRLLKSKRHRLGSKHPETLRAAAHLAKIYQMVGKVDEGLQLEDEVLKHATGEDPQTFLTLSLIGWTAFWCKDYFRAETVWLRLHALERKNFGEDHYKPLEILQNISRAYYGQGRYDDSLKTALNAYNAKRRTLHQDHMSLLCSLKDLAMLYDRHGRYDNASSYASQLYDARRRILGQDHKRTHDCMELLAGIGFRQQHYEEADELTSLLWQSRKAMLGPNHQETLKAMGSLAIVSSEQARLRKDEESFNKYIITLHRKLGDGHIDAWWFAKYIPRAYPRQCYDVEVEQLIAEAVGFVPLPEDDEADDELFGGSSPDRESNNDAEAIDTLDGGNG